MNLQIGYESREISTDDLSYGLTPALVFSMKFKPSYGWYELVQQIDSDERDIVLHSAILAGICFSVSDGKAIVAISTKEDAIQVYDTLKAAIPEIADELYCDLVRDLAGEFLRSTRERVATLKKTSAQSNGKSPKRSRVKQS